MPEKEQATDIDVFEEELKAVFTHRTEESPKKEEKDAVVNPFLPVEFDKEVKYNQRKLQFKVGVNISQEGLVRNSFGLRFMEKMR